MSCRCLLSHLSLTAWPSSSSTLALSLASFRASSLALLFSLSFCGLVNSAFSCRFSELTDLVIVVVHRLKVSFKHVMPSLYGCYMHAHGSRHTMCFAGCVYTEVALSPTCSSMWPLLERSVHVTSDFHCEWAIVATQTMASTDETFLPWGSPYRSSDWTGRSTSGLRPCCCHWRGTTVRVFSE